MFQYKGIWLPDGETHYQTVMDSPKNPERGGKGTYQYRKMKKAIQATPEPRRTAIDIGGNVGFFSMFFVQHFEEVHVFEPIESFRECFEKNVGPATNCIMHIQALGAEEFEWPMITGNPGQTGNTFLDPDYDSDTESDVDLIPVKTLDSFNFKEVDLIKLDCEGYEEFVLRGGEETIRKNKPTIIVEQKPGWPSVHGLLEKGAVTYLESLGMALRFELSGDFILDWG